MSAQLGLYQQDFAGMFEVLDKRKKSMLPHRRGDASDTELLRRIGDGDHTALETLYEHYFPRVFRFAQRMLSSRESIEEIVNDVMYVVWRKASTFNSEGQVSTWIFGIAYRTCLKKLADRSPGEHLTLDDAEDLIPGVSDSGLDALELEDWVTRLFEQLPVEQRAVLELTYHQDLKYSEIAAILGCPENTVKTRMFHARKKIKALMPNASEQSHIKREGTRL